MNEKKLNMAIAKWMGWTEEKCYWGGMGLFPPNSNISQEPPDFTTDLNAIASAEAKLSDEQYRRFRTRLDRICSDDYYELKIGQHFSSDPVSATALQRATALAKALNLSVDP